MPASILNSILILVVSLYILARAANLTVAHIIRIAQHFRISEAFIGISILSVSTGLPELGVTVMAALSGNPTLSLGNILGSNVANICLVIGIGALVSRIRLTRKGLLRTVRILVLISIIPVVLVMVKHLNWIVGLVLLSIFAGYTLLMVQREHAEIVVSHHTKPKISIPKSFYFFIVGIVGVIIASKMVVNSAVLIAQTFGLSNTFIGVTMVALGTSLPELSIDIVAIQKKHIDLALGDAIGSCLINLTLILGVLGLLSNITINIHTVLFPALFGVLVAIIFWYMLEVRREIDTKNAIFLLLLYFLFLMLAFLNEVGTPFF